MTLIIRCFCLLALLVSADHAGNSPDEALDHQVSDFIVAGNASPPLRSSSERPVVFLDIGAGNASGFPLVTPAEWADDDLDNEVNSSLLQSASGGASHSAEASLEEQAAEPRKDHDDATTEGVFLLSEENILNPALRLKSMVKSLQHGAMKQIAKVLPSALAAPALHAPPKRPAPHHAPVAKASTVSSDFHKQGHKRHRREEHREEHRVDRREGNSLDHHRGRLYERRSEGHHRPDEPVNPSDLSATLVAKAAASSPDGPEGAPSPKRSPMRLVTVYHQTSRTRGKHILRTGFKPGAEGWCGGGVYFARTPEATTVKTTGPNSRRGFVIKALVNIGRPLRLYKDCKKMTPKKLKAMGYDSIIFSPGDGEEVVIYDPRRVVRMREVPLKHGHHDGPGTLHIRHHDIMTHYTGYRGGRPLHYHHKLPR